ncbi:MAG: hypothetical protein WDA74_03575 [Spirochaetota bacterium]
MTIIKGKGIIVIACRLKSVISVLTAIFFFTSIYLAPSASAITLGEIKPETGRSTKENISNEERVVKPDADAPVNPQAEDDTDIKNPRLVCLLSVIMPGGGHFYINQDAKGLSFCIAAGIGYTATGYFLIKASLADRGSREYKNYLLMTGFLFFMTLIVHFVGIVEAYSDADELGKKNLFGSNADNPYGTKIIYEK